MSCNDREPANPPSRSEILYIIGSLDVGGTENQLLRLLPYVVERGFDASVFCVARRGAQASLLESQGIRVIESPLHPRSERPRLFIRLVRLMVVAPYLLYFLLRNRPRIVHMFLPASYLIGAPLTLLARIPIVVMSRRSLNYYQRARPLVRRLESFWHKRMTAVIGNSQRVVAQLIDDEAAPRERTVCIHNGVDVRAFERTRSKNEVRQELGIEQGALVLISLANLIPYKGHADLLRGLSRVSDELPSKWILLCVGRDDGIGESLRELAGTLRMDSHVRWMGSRSDVADLLGAADISVLASHQEGFSNAIIESMAAGLPVVATDVGGNGEAVVDGEAGLLVPPRDSGALGKAIAKLAKDPKYRKKLGAAGQRRARDCFSLERSVEAHVVLYESLLKGDASFRELLRRSAGKRLVG
jgi:glycosyltransferase involved in cell wall biosynthesis